MSQNPDVRWRQRLQSFRKALGQLSNGVKIAEERSLSDLETQGLIQAFEFTHELSWKVMKAGHDAMMSSSRNMKS